MPRKILNYWHCTNYELWWSDFLVHHPFQHVRQSFLSLATLAFSKSWHSRCIYHLHFTTDQPNSPPISLDNFSPCLWCANVPLTSSWRCNFLSLPNLSQLGTGLRLNWTQRLWSWANRYMVLIHKKQNSTCVLSCEGGVCLWKLVCSPPLLCRCCLTLGKHWKNRPRPYSLTSKTENTHLHIYHRLS